MNVQSNGVLDFLFCEEHIHGACPTVLFLGKTAVSERRLSPKMAAIVFPFLLMKMSNMIFF